MEKTKQLSVFLENKTGRINQVARILGDNGINMHAFSVAETADFGIIRMIVSDVELASKVMKEAHFAVRITEVVCIKCSNSAGALSEILDVLANANVFIEYMYAFSEGDTARVVIRPTDLELCLKVLNENHCDVISV
ncbi:MAG: ACT domain-containing protein [Marinifilaceae bacterium]|nr:ACT domain-containing protein [Marinifilaceae bacterium]